MDLSGIMAVLPHRYPMLLLDRVVEIVPGRSLVARKAVSGAEPWYTGDVASVGYPPVLLVESWCQAAAVLSLGAGPAGGRPAGGGPAGEADADKVLLFGSISGLRLTGRVLPGDVVEHHVRLTRAVADTVVVHGESRVGDAVVLAVDRVLIARRPAAALRARDVLVEAG
jgi:3-hydroxyacyl-[acyl-carrier-protein] dehydratase